MEIFPFETISITFQSHREAANARKEMQNVVSTNFATVFIEKEKDKKKKGQ